MRFSTCHGQKNSKRLNNAEIPSLHYLFDWSCQKLYRTHQQTSVRGHVKKPSVDLQNFVEIDVQRANEGSFLRQFISKFWSTLSKLHFISFSENINFLNIFSSQTAFLEHLVDGTDFHKLRIQEWSRACFSVSLKTQISTVQIDQKSFWTISALKGLKSPEGQLWGDLPGECFRTILAHLAWSWLGLIGHCHNLSWGDWENQFLEDGSWTLVWMIDEISDTLIDDHFPIGRSHPILIVATDIRRWWKVIPAEFFSSRVRDSVASMDSATAQTWTQMSVICSLGIQHSIFKGTLNTAHLSVFWIPIPFMLNSHSIQWTIRHSFDFTFVHTNHKWIVAESIDATESRTREGCRLGWPFTTWISVATIRIGCDLPQLGSDHQTKYQLDK